MQTTLIAFAWWQIFKFGYPNAVIPYKSILAAYAAGVSINNFVPASLGTLVSLLMYTALIAGATFTGVIGATVVQKIFFTVSGRSSTCTCSSRSPARSRSSSGTSEHPAL